MRSGLLLLLSLAAAPALAQSPPVQQLYGCAAEHDAAARLACFDAAVAALKKAEAQGEVTIVSRQQAREADRQAFGLPGPTSVAKSLATVAPPPKESAAKPLPPAEPLETITLTVVSISDAPNGDRLFTMENGQVWRQIEHDSLGKLGKGPWTAEIRKAALGSFMLKLDGKTAVRVKRVK